MITIASVRLVGACNSFQNSNSVTAHPSFIYLDSKDPGDKTLMIAQCSAGQNVAGNALSSLELVYAQQAMPTLSGGGGTEYFQSAQGFPKQQASKPCSWM